MRRSRTTGEYFSRAQTALLLVFSVVVLAPAPARAHAQLLRANPAEGAELDAGPAEIDLWFNELLDEGFNSIMVIPAAQIAAPHPEDHATGTARIDSADQTHLVCPVAPMPPGDWLVQWRVLSRDGHPARGQTAFRIRRAN
jgi:methionine-rich copper-binding protein CopC